MFKYIALIIIYSLATTFTPNNKVHAIDNFIKNSSNPILTPTINSWDGERVWQPSVIFDGTEYKMYYSAYNGNEFQIGLAHSDNGVSWIKDSNNPIVSRLNIDGKDSHDPHVIYNGSSYYMWYVSSDNGGSSNFAIQRAYSVNGINWINDPILPVLKLTTGWGSIQGVSSPSVLKIGNIFKMWYSSQDTGVWSTGVADSLDGIVWNPNALNPIIIHTKPWEDGQAANPNVSYDGIKYLMYYGGTSHIAYAESNDGITWSKPDSNPALTSSQPFDINRLGNASRIILSNNSPALYYDGLGTIDGVTTWRIGVAIDGPMPSPSTTTTPIPSPTPTIIPTPTMIPTTKIVIIPGMGGSWNQALMWNCQPGTGNETWTQFGTSLNPLIKQLQDRGFTVLPLYYDWRRTPNQTAGYLATLINNVVQPNEKVNVLAHSYGGLVARAYIEQTQNEAKIDSLLTAGTPYNGGVDAYLAWAGADTQSIIDLKKRFNLEVIKHRCGTIQKITPLRALQQYDPGLQYTLPTFNYLRSKTTNVLKPTASMFYQNPWLTNTQFTFPYYGIRVGTFTGIGRQTASEIVVKPPNAIESSLGYWKDGKPVKINKTLLGDNLVLQSSAQLSSADNSLSGVFAHESLITSQRGIDKILGFFGTPNILSTLNTFNMEEPASGLAIISDQTSVDLETPSGEKISDINGLIFLSNPTTGKHKTTFRLKSDYGSIAIVQLLKDGRTIWNNYSFRGKYTSYKKSLQFNEIKPQEDPLQ